MKKKIYLSDFSHWKKNKEEEEVLLNSANNFAENAVYLAP